MIHDRKYGELAPRVVDSLGRKRACDYQAGKGIRDFVSSQGGGMQIKPSFDAVQDELRHSITTRISTDYSHE